MPHEPMHQDDTAALRKPSRFAAMRRRQLNKQRVMLFAGGAVLVLVGIPLTPTPVPLGLLMVAAGLYLMARSSDRVMRGIRSLREAWPVFSSKLNALKPRAPRGLRRFIEQSDPSRPPPFRLRRRRASSPPSGDARPDAS